MCYQWLLLIPFPPRSKQEDEHYYHKCLSSLLLPTFESLRSHQSCLQTVAAYAHVASQRWQQSINVERCLVAVRISSYGCIRVTSCCEHQRNVISKLAWSCRRAFLDRWRAQLEAVDAIWSLASLHSYRRGNSVHLTSC